MRPISHEIRGKSSGRLFIKSGHNGGGRSGIVSSICVDFLGHGDVYAAFSTLPIARAFELGGPLG